MLQRVNIYNTANEFTFSVLGPETVELFAQTVA